MKKGFLIAGAVLVFAGLALMIGAAAGVGFDFARLGTAEYETNTYTPGEGFHSIEIDTDESDIEFRTSEDGTCRVVCTELEKARHQVSVENGILKITRDDRREWSDRLMLFSNSQSVTVYLPLPSDGYESLNVVSGTGDVLIPGGFTFGSITVTGGTGEVTCNASASGTVRIGTSTGGIRMNSASAGSIELKVSTGKIQLGEIACRETLSVSVGTGKTLAEDVTCGSFVSEGSTGSLTLKNAAVSGNIRVRRSTGDIRLENCDAAEIEVRTTTGDVTGSLRSAKVFAVQTNTGSVRVPDTVTGGKCEIRTSTGDVRIEIAGS